MSEATFHGIYGKAARLDGHCDADKGKKSKEREDINLNKIINHDDGVTAESVMANSNIVTEV